IVLLPSQRVLLLFKLFLGSKQGLHAVKKSRISNDIGFFVALKPDEIAIDFSPQRARMLQVFLIAGHGHAVGIGMDDYIARAGSAVVRAAVDIDCAYFIRCLLMLLLRTLFTH